MLQRRETFSINGATSPPSEEARPQIASHIIFPFAQTPRPTINILVVFLLSNLYFDVPAPKSASSSGTNETSEPLALEPTLKRVCAYTRKLLC